MSSASDTATRRGAYALVCSNVCSTAGPQGPVGPTGPQGEQGPARPVGSAVTASYYSMTTQTISSDSANPTVFTFDQTFIQHDISRVSDTKMVVPYTGTYEVWYSIQIHRTSGGSPEYIYVWLKVNGNTVSNSNGRININSNNGDSLPIVPYILDLNAGDYVEFAAYATDTNNTINILAVTGLTPMPNIPSIIVGIKQI